MPVRGILVLALASVSSLRLRADVSYQVTAQASAGSLFDPSAKPIVFTRYIKGNRMAEVWKDHTVIIDLDKEIIAAVDLPKKTYSVITFAQMKEKVALARADTGPEVQAKPSGRTQAVGVLTARETLITIHASGEKGPFTTEAAIWATTVPGYEEARSFQRKLGEKLGYAFASGMSPFTMDRDAAVQGFAEIERQLSKLDGAPLERTVTIADAAEGMDPSAFAPTHPRAVSAAAAAAGATLGRIGLGHKKQAQPATSVPGLLIAVSVELTNISSAPLEAGRLDTPPGFTLRK